ncbi:sodium-coupled monocarboxylate transporter 1-like isoform X2 [Lycorma delicatula]|uniref:sodium-coupled monocarboxylate transporter 1-like isoform X2 n=1 Tax=Lycorma delicatula TaxID=130591 RepID=UPI003F510D9E
MFRQTFAHFIMALVFSVSTGEERVSAVELVEKNITCDPFHRSNNSFHWLDYVIVATMLIVSCGIGTFYGFFGKKQETSADFLLGGRGMGTIPMSMSLAAGFITAIELLGNPAEMYVYGTMFWLQCISYLLVVPIASHLYLPVFMKLHLTSSYEYLEMRFNKCARVIAAALYTFQMILYTSVAVYAPALALSHVTGLDVYVAVSLVYLVCVFYASQGGMKAVIMADTFQAVVLILSIATILILGNSVVGGFSNIIESNIKSGRIEFLEFSLDPTVRHSVWSVVIGGTFYWATMFCSNQASIQKYLTVETIGQARRALWISSISLVVVLSINFYTGMIMYHNYEKCDPLKINVISASDQLLPLFVKDSLGSFKGLQGLFVAGIFAASLGTVASALNSMAAVTMKDFFGSVCGLNIPDNKGSLYSKWISVFYGFLSFFLIFIVEHLGSLLQVALSFNGMSGGVTLGLFSLGMFIPWANSKGVLSGAIVAGGLILWIGFGAQIAIANGLGKAAMKPVSIENCYCNNTHEISNTSVFIKESSEEIWSVYRISYLWYSAIGFFVTMFVGIIVSLITGPQDPCRVNSDLISPPVQCLLKKLPNHLKERLSLPLESKTMAVNLKEKKTTISEIGGIVNPAVNLDHDVLT